MRTQSKRILEGRGGGLFERFFFPNPKQLRLFSTLYWKPLYCKKKKQKQKKKTPRNTIVTSVKWDGCIICDFLFDFLLLNRRIISNLVGFFSSFSAFSASWSNGGSVAASSSCSTTCISSVWKSAMKVTQSMLASVLLACAAGARP